MLYAIVAVIALILDQAVKYWTTVNIVVDTGEAKLIPGLIHLANVHNTGAAFSFLEGARWFFVILCIIFVLIVIYALAKDLLTDKVCRWAAVFVMAGAIGNCIDRIVCGYVVDMFEFDFLIFKRPFPVFNLADIFITLGVIAFCVALLLEKPGAKAKKPVAPAADAAEDTAPAAKAKVPSAARSAEAKPMIRRRQKVEIPDFPKHDLSDVPALDPNDPFAEWEKRANAPKSAPEAPISNPVIYTQPAAAEAAQQNTVRFTSAPVEPVRPAAPVKPEAAPVRPSVPVRQPAVPAEPPAVPAQPIQPAKPAQPETDEFDLESILAEFKDF